MLSSSILVGKALNGIDDYGTGQRASNHHSECEAEAAAQAAAEHEPGSGGERDSAQWSPPRICCQLVHIG